MNWQDNWVVDSTSRPRSGGQGRVQKVRDPRTGQLGALKVLHDGRQSDERRYRLQGEVAALQRMEGAGVPRILDANSELWRDRSTDLYVVTEWVDGPTLGDHVKGVGPVGLDSGLAVGDALASIVVECHRLGIVHRDIKPDNIILRGGKLSDPVLVDFGQAWSADRPEDDFETDGALEMGNRFLRLPEHAADAGKRDPRADVAMLVGVLFFVLTGRMPRVLRNPENRSPEEVHADAFSSIQADHRWPALRRLFHQGFQVSVEARFQTAAVLSESIKIIAATPTTPQSLSDALGRLDQAILDDADYQHRERKRIMTDLSDRFATAMKQLSSGSKLAVGDRSSVFEDEEYAVISQANVGIHPKIRPPVLVKHRLRFRQGIFEWEYSVGGENYIRYSVSPADELSDVDGPLMAAAERALADVARHLHAAIQSPSPTKPHAGA